MMPKKRPADDRGGGRRAAKVSETRRRRRHLYLVLDDWERGHSIRKLDLSSPDSDSDVVGSSSTTQQRLPPAVFRVEAPHALSALFTTFGTKIVATHQTPRRAALMWDVSTRALTFGPRHKYEPNSLCNAYVEVSGQLFLVDDASFEVLDPPPPPPPLDDGVEIVWKWQRLPPPPSSLTPCTPTDGPSS
ncbi:hypothetical protein QOZ80_2AG0133200 [Eleusine coracana subsp. coracana]|nr:hypothetical protein QOZ80_2AG0133200 [Eleusine coracana subsp. coracana]